MNAESPALARPLLQRAVEEFLYGEEAPCATRVSGLRGAPRLVPGRLRALGAWGATKHPECTLPDLTIHFEGTLALAA